MIAALPLATGIRVVDLSVDFQLADVDEYAMWYDGKNKEHTLLLEAL